MSFVTNSIERSNALPIVKVTYDIIFQASSKHFIKVLQIKWFKEILIKCFWSIISSVSKCYKYSGLPFATSKRQALVDLGFKQRWRSLKWSSLFLADIVQAKGKIEPLIFGDPTINC